MLKRYTERHDSIIKYTHKIVKHSLMEDIELYIDLSADFQIASTMRTDIAITVQRPHIVAVNRCHNKVIFLISQFNNLDDTHYQKVK